jgi:hypothetical protein
MADQPGGRNPPRCGSTELDGGWKYNPGDIMLRFNTGNKRQVAYNLEVYDVAVGHVGRSPRSVNRKLCAACLPLMLYKCFYSNPWDCVFVIIRSGAALTR